MSLLSLRKNALEWAVFAISLALVAALVAVLASGVGGPAGPPRLTVAVGAAEAHAGGGVAYPVVVRNDGPETAAEVDVEVSGPGGRSAGERARVRFDYVPRHSERRGVAVFAAEPGGPVGARILAFTEP